MNNATKTETRLATSVTESVLWGSNVPVSALDEDVPAWVGEMSVSQAMAVYQGGCASGAYMPAVTYATALEVMNEHGNDVLAYIEDAGYEDESFSFEGKSWAGIAVAFLSTAVDNYCNGMISDLLDGSGRMEPAELYDDSSEYCSYVEGLASSLQVAAEDTDGEACLALFLQGMPEADAPKYRDWLAPHPNLVR
jgi:hypothetical protein